MSLSIYTDDFTHGGVLAFVDHIFEIIKDL